jgi:hypothetical protein
MALLDLFEASVDLSVFGDSGAPDTAKMESRGRKKHRLPGFFLLAAVQ